MTSSQPSVSVDELDYEDIPCDLCGADDWRELFLTADVLLKVDDRQHRLVQCRRCGLMYLNPRPVGAELARYYPDSYEPFTATDSLSGKIAGVVERRNAGKIASKLASGSSILEVGCGAGALLSRLSERGFAVRGVEYSPFAVKEAQEAGLDVFQGDLFEADLPSEEFDAVILKHVIEHLPSPSKALKEINRILKPGGQVILWLPNADSFEAGFFGRYWHGYDVPRHLFDFTGSTLSAMLADRGFEVTSLTFSRVPNDLIRSSKHWMGDRFGWSVPWFTTKNVFLLALFTPVSAVLGLMKRSCRMTIFATKTADV